MTRLLAIFNVIFLSFCLLLQTAWADALPDLGDSSEVIKEDGQYKKASKQFRAAILKSPLRMRDPVIEAYIQKLGRRLLEKGDKGYSFYMIKSPMINAFTGLDNIIVLHSELFLKADSLDEVAAVLAHEIAHAKQLHLLRMIAHNQNMRIPMLLGSIAAIALSTTTGAGGGVMVAGLAAFQQERINFTRQHESEADHIGMNLLARAGFDPTAMAGFFKRLAKLERLTLSSDVPSMLKTHPVTLSRISDAQNRAAFLPKKKRISGGDFKLIQTRIKVLSTNDLPGLYQYYKTRQQQSPYGYALILERMQEFKRATRLMEKIYKQNPSDLIVKWSLAELYLTSGQGKKAVSIYQKLHEQFPHQRAISLQYAKTLLAADDFLGTIDVLNMMLYDDPKQIDVLALLAQAYNRHGDKAEAYFNQAKISWLKGKAKLAKQQFKQAKKLAGNNRLLRAKISMFLDGIYQKH